MRKTEKHTRNRYLTSWHVKSSVTERSKKCVNVNYFTSRNERLRDFLGGWSKKSLGKTPLYFRRNPGKRRGLTPVAIRGLGDPRQRAGFRLRGSSEPRRRNEAGTSEQRAVCPAELVTWRKKKKKPEQKRAPNRMWTDLHYRWWTKHEIKNQMCPKRCRDQASLLNDIMT